MTFCVDEVEVNLAGFFDLVENSEAIVTWGHWIKRDLSESLATFLTASLGCSCLGSANSIF